MRGIFSILTVPVGGENLIFLKKKVKLLFYREKPKLERRFQLGEDPFVLPGSYVGQSTCNNFTTVLGAGQRVLSYSYYRLGRAEVSNLRYLDILLKAKFPIAIQLKSQYTKIKLYIFSLDEGKEKI